MSAEPRRYLTHDMDQGRVELVVQAGENGDWYVSIVPEGHKVANLDVPDDMDRLHSCVRVTTSGERREHIGVANAVADLYRAMGGERAEMLWIVDDSRRVEPLSEDELAGIGRVCSEPSEGAAAELRDIIARLLATIRARDEEIVRLRGAFGMDGPWPL